MFEQSNQMRACFNRLYMQLPAVETKKNSHLEKRDPLISTHEWMVHQQRPEHRGRHCNDVFVIAALWPIKSTLEQPQVTHARRPAKAFY